MGIAAKKNISLITLGIIARNEEEALPALLEDIKGQSFPHERMEIILVDGMSTDSTRKVMRDFVASSKSSFYDVFICQNEKEIQPCGWNMVIDKSRGDAIIRVDAHARIPSDFVAECVAVLDEGEDVCGGVRPTVMNNPTAWQKVLHMAEESAFGSSIASYRRESSKRYVSSIFHGAYRREVFEKVGMFDERLSRTEDNELHYRIRKNGYKICLSPQIYSEQLARGSFGKMLRQKYLNGYWIGKTLYIEPCCFRLYHFVPLVFVLALISLLLVGCFFTWTPFFAALFLYGVADVLLSALAICSSRVACPQALLLPLLFPCIHVAYGVGTLIGIVVGSAWVRKTGRG